MSQPAALVDDEPLTRLLASLRGAGLFLLLGVAALIGLFHVEAMNAVRTWIDSTAYNHCFLVVPIVIWLIWDRRFSLHGLAAAPLPVAALLIPPLAAVWLAAERLGIMEGRQLVALTMVEVLFLATLGWRLWRALMGPLLYLYFLVPFGEFLTPKLQDVTTWFTRHGLNLLGIPAYIDGYIIEIPEGTFFVAEACAGLRFLIASIAFGALYALMMYRSPFRRLAFILLSIAVPIVANGIRAMGIVVLGHILGSAEAGAADHIIYGWVFFSFVILLLILAGLPFREDSEPDPVNLSPMAPAQGGSLMGLAAAAGVVLLAAAGPLSVFALGQASASMPPLTLKPLDFSPACLNTGATITPPPGMIGQTMAQQVDCGGIVLNVLVEVFPPRSTAGPVGAEQKRLTRPTSPEDSSETVLAPGDNTVPSAWHIVASTEPAFVAAAAVWINGETFSPGMAMRLAMARTSVFGTAFAPVLVVVIPAANWTHVETAEKRRMAERIALFVRETPGIGDQIREISKRAGGGG